MLLPAALEELHVKRLIIPPHPGLFSALGLLSTDLVYYDSRSAYVLLAPDTAPQIDGVFEEMERGLRERAGAAAEGAVVRRSFDGRLWGQSWETPFVDVPGRPDHGRDDRRDDRELPRRVRPALRQHASPTSRCRASATACELVVEAPKVEYRAAGARRRRRGRRRTARSSCATSRREPIEAGEYARASVCRSARRHPGPGDHPRGAVDHLRPRRPDRRRSAPYGELVISPGRPR